MPQGKFWSSVVLTGNSTTKAIAAVLSGFWSSVVLTGNSTVRAARGGVSGFGAVSF